MACKEKRKERYKEVKLRRITLLTVLILLSFTTGLAQSTSVENLRSQLGNVQKKEDELQARVKQIEEDMKPENIERFFALSGSTRPEEVREQRRRQLEGERANVRAQLDQLARSRSRLETAIATAEAAAYRQSALPSSYNPTPVINAPDSPTVKPKQNQRRNRQRARRARRRT